MFLKKFLLRKCYVYGFFLIKQVPLNDLNLVYCKFHIDQKIIIEYIENIIKEALEVFLSTCIYCWISVLYTPYLV